MRYFVIVLLLVFSACGGSKILSEQTNTVKTIEVNSRDVTVKFDRLGVFDTTDLNQLQRGLVIAKQDAKTGIKTSYQIKGNNLIAEIEVPEREKVIQVRDTTTTIKSDTVVIKEQKKSFWQGLKSWFNTIFITIAGLIVIFIIFKLLKI